MFQKIFKNVKTFIMEEYKLLLICFAIFILFFYPVDYYIIIGGGISDISSRIEVGDSYQSSGSFNMSYVSELTGTLGPYLLSYIIPSWDRESANLYKYNVTESIEDIEFRSDLGLQSSNSNAVYWAYKLANKECRVASTKIYVISVMSDFETEFVVGDLLLSINDKYFDTLSEYQEYIKTLTAEDIAIIKVLRDGKEISFESKLYQYEGRVILGIYLQMVKEYETDPKVEFKFGSDESGPSAGLITTLSIYDKLTEEDLTHSLKIAGTGTIEEDGSIGEIGGVQYKLIGAEAGGADIFLVPSGSNYEECLKIKKEKKLKIQLIEVKTIEDAISKLEAMK